MTDAPADDLVERLKATDLVDNGHGGGKLVRRNPDGLEAAARIRSLEAQRDEAVGLLREAVPELETYPDEPDDVDRAAWLSNGLKRRTVAFLDSLKEGRS
ncbi:hypothetical protein [Brevundimonas sp. FT23028]|uniref:hypothetical protein n=1 Tax=Brevundimonas sp. FT23028 TaxID=3393748 RepID=UPI003B58710F